MLPRIVNVVATCNLNCNLDLKQLAECLLNIEYNPAKFIAIIKKLRRPSATILIFPNGKLVITGAKNETMAKMAARKVARIIEKLGIWVNLSKFEVRNIVATFNFKELNIKKKENTIINLNNIAKLDLPGTVYVPELFPGLIYTVLNVKLVVFHTGKINFTGAKSVMEIMNAFAVFKKFLFLNKIITE